MNYTKTMETIITKGIDGRWPSSAHIQSRARAGLRTLDARTRRLVEEQPYTAVLVVAAAGYVLARIASR